MATYNTYSSEQEEFLKTNAPLMSRKELTELFNSRFGANRTVAGIKAFCNSRGYNSSFDGKFQKGNISWHKGLSKEEYRSHFTEESFRRMTERAIQGNRTKKIGDEVVVDGQPYVVFSLEAKVPFWERIKPKRRYVWEQLHGEIPKDHCIVCLDGNPMNCEPSNLYCMPIRFRPLLSKNKWWFGNAELTLAAIKWCELHYAIKEVFE